MDTLMSLFYMMSSLLLALVSYDAYALGLSSPNAVVACTLILMVGMVWFKQRAGTVHFCLLATYAALIAYHCSLLPAVEWDIAPSNLAMYAMVTGLLFITHEART